MLISGFCTKKEFWEIIELQVCVFVIVRTNSTLSIYSTSQRQDYDNGCVFVIVRTNSTLSIYSTSQWQDYDNGCYWCS
jgi:hypothetical protein